MYVCMYSFVQIVPPWKYFRYSDRFAASLFRPCLGRFLFRLSDFLCISAFTFLSYGSFWAQLLYIIDINTYICTYIVIYIYVYLYICVYICIYISTETSSSMWLPWHLSKNQERSQSVARMCKYIRYRVVHLLISWEIEITNCIFTIY